MMGGKGGGQLICEDTLVGGGGGGMGYIGLLECRIFTLQREAISERK